MDRWWFSRPFVLVVATAVAVAGLWPAVLVLSVAPTPPVAGFLALQLMLLTAAAFLSVNPESRAHALRLLVASVLTGLALTGNEPIGDIGYWGQFSWPVQWAAVPLIATVLLAYPGSRVEPRAHRALITLLWFWAIVPRTVGTLLYSHEGLATDGPGLSIVIAPLNDLAMVVITAGDVLGVGLTAWYVAAQTQRSRAAHGAARIPVRLAASTGAALAVTLGIRIVTPWLISAGRVPASVDAWVAQAQNAIGVLAGIALVVIAVRAATRRGAVVERLLAAGGDPAAVQDVLRAELVDPSLVLSLRRATGWIAVDGSATGVPGPERVERVIVDDSGEAIARIDADDQVLADPAGLRITLAATSMAVQNTRLTLERAAHLAEIDASRVRIVEAGIAKRRELERDLHDGAQQSLLAVAATLSRASLSDDPDEMRAVVGDARGQLAAALDELRSLARGIHPAALSQGGLAGGLASLAVGIPGLDVSLDDGVATAHLPSAVESTAYYVIAESVTNAVKHGGDCSVAVDVGLSGSGLLVAVTDDGPGGATMSPGGGLAGLRDRVRALGGSLEVHSAMDGTRVQAVLPVGAAT
ncbi:sensor histidine kinase [Cellulomonas sp.]|uniref:sensor histidine kinase n=1 Tax=Cellulomonas sp. TaxID=40001 RepID=UPI003BAA414D